MANVKISQLSPSGPTAPGTLPADTDLVEVENASGVSLKQTRYQVNKVSWLHLINDLGAIGDNTLHPLSERYATLGEAQVDYPAATSLTDSIDWAALQKGVDAETRVFCPVGSFVINRSIRVGLEELSLLGDNVGKVSRTEIIGDPSLGTFPMFHNDGGYVDIDYVLRDNDGNVSSPGADPSAPGLVLTVENIWFEHLGTRHSGIFMMAGIGGPSSFKNCKFFPINGRGVAMGFAFSLTYIHCGFVGDWAIANQGAAKDELIKRAALTVTSHTTVIGCDFQANPTSIVAQRAQCTIIGCRVEVSLIGILTGGIILEWGSVGQTAACSVSQISTVSFEQNTTALEIDSANVVSISDIGIQGSDAVLTSENGVIINNESSTLVLDNIITSGVFTVAAILYRAPFKGKVRNVLGVVGSEQPRGLMSLFDTEQYDFHGINRSVEFDIKSDLVLRGLTGINLDKSAVIAKNFGAVQTVTETATSEAVVFRIAVSVGDAGFATGPTAVVDGGSTLPAEDYEYGVTLGNGLGETGVADAVDGISLKAVTIASGEKAEMTFFGGAGSDDSTFRRVYRRIAGEEAYQGYFEFAPTTSFDDTGQAFDGADIPPAPGSTVPSAIEADVNYEVVLSPNWLTTWRIINKATTGFTMDFGTPAPANSSAAWLMFRP